MKMFRVTYSRKANRNWRQTVDMTEQCYKGIIDEFGSLNAYFKKIISEPVIVEDHYLVNV